MIVLSKPYVSDMLANTLRSSQTPVVKADDVYVPNEQELNFLNEESFLHGYPTTETSSILCNSEASLRFISKHLNHYPTGHVIHLFKNKGTFRRFMQADYPHYYFQTLRLGEWSSIDPSTLPYPVIVKPTVGYSSIGVYKVDHAGQWHSVMNMIEQVLNQAAYMYSRDVVNADELIIERWIEGAEYAVDAYFDANGEPVILNVFARMFAYDGDTSDRIYYTDKRTMQDMIGPLTAFLSSIGERLTLRNFPLHAEVRRTPDGTLIPVEVNPLRFAGIGTTELGLYAYGINPYQCFLKQIKPDWGNILRNMDNAVYSFFCAEAELQVHQTVQRFDHEGLKTCFQEILDYRIMPREYNTFAVVFYRSASLLENHRLLKLNLAPYMMSTQAGLA